MKRFILSILTLTSMLLAIGISNAYATNAEDDFFKANQAYRNGDYADAVHLYSKLAGKENPSPDILYNLGNAYFRLGDKGVAILNYEKARIFLPRDADLNFNLGYVRDRLQDAVEPPGPPLQSVFFWLDSMSPNELFALFAVANLLFFAALILRIFIKEEWAFVMLIVLLVAWLGAGVSFGVKCYQTAYDDRAVIISKEASVLAGPDTKDTELFRLHAGTVVRTDKREGGWTLIRLTADKRGWVPDSSIGMIKG
jgi:tetratricopeptide (TPR) repeat protein